MDIVKYKDRPLRGASTRIPNQVYELAKKMAEDKNVKISDVYRTAIMVFFQESSVNKTETKLYSNEGQGEME